MLIFRRRSASQEPGNELSGTHPLVDILAMYHVVVSDTGKRTKGRQGREGSGRRGGGSGFELLSLSVRGGQNLGASISLDS